MESSRWEGEGGAPNFLKQGPKQDLLLHFGQIVKGFFYMQCIEIETSGCNLNIQSLCKSSKGLD